MINLGYTKFIPYRKYTSILTILTSLCQGYNINSTFTSIISVTWSGIESASLESRPNLSVSTRCYCQLNGSFVRSDPANHDLCLGMRLRIIPSGQQLSFSKKKKNVPVHLAKMAPPPRLVVKPFMPDGGWLPRVRACVSHVHTSDRFGTLRHASEAVDDDKYRVEQGRRGRLHGVCYQPGRVWCPRAWCCLTDQPDQAPSPAGFLLPSCSTLR